VGLVGVVDAGPPGVACDLCSVVWVRYVVHQAGLRSGQGRDQRSGKLRPARFVVQDGCDALDAWVPQ
jgi:hypothetical protein